MGRAGAVVEFEKGLKNAFIEKKIPVKKPDRQVIRKKEDLKAPTKIRGTDKGPRRPSGEAASLELR